MISSSRAKSNVVSTVLDEILYLASPDSDLPRPIALFGITARRAASLYETFRDQFVRIATILNKNRQKEIQQLKEKFSFSSTPLVEEHERIFEKYQNLIEIYRDRPGLTYELAAWRKDALGPINTSINASERAIENMPTPLRNRSDRFELVEVRMGQLLQVRRRLAEINEQYDLENGYYLQDELPADVRKEYQECSTENLRVLGSPYVFLTDLEARNEGNLPLNFVLENFSRRTGDLGLYRWGIVCFEPSLKYWGAQASQELQSLIYSGFRILDYGVEISPIENRLKDELDIRGIKYKFQHPFKGYVLDFFLESDGRFLNVECDGREFHSSQDAINYDRTRNNMMAASGIYVLRFSGSEIWNDVSKCVDLIEEALK